MGKIAAAIWVVVLFILNSVFVQIISINGFMPDLLLAFLVVYAFMKRRFAAVSYMTIICALLNGAITGRVFLVATMVTGVAGMIAYNSSNYLRFVHESIRIAGIAFAMSFVTEIFEYFFTYHTLMGGVILGNVLPDAIYTAVASGVIYLIIKKTSFKNEDKQLLMIEERVGEWEKTNADL